MGIKPSDRAKTPLETGPFIFADSWTQLAVTRDNVLKVTFTTALPGVDERLVAARVALPMEAAKRFVEAVQTAIERLEALSHEAAGRA